MPQKTQIGALQAGALLLTLLTTKAFLMFPSLMVRLAQTGAWLQVVAVAIAALGGTALLILLLEKVPGRGLAEIAVEVAGPTLGALLCVALGLWILGLSAATLRMFTENFLTAILPRTPPSAIMLITLLAMLYAAYTGIEAIARANLLLVPLMFLALLVVLLLVSPRLHLDALFPIWGPGPRAVAVAGIRHAGYLSEALIVAVYGYALGRRTDFRRVSLWGLLIGTTSLALLVAFHVALVGPEQAQLQPFPFYDLARTISIHRFLQRLESGFVLLWGLSAAFFLSAGLHALSITTATALGLPYHRPLLFPIATLMFSLALVPDNFTAAARMNEWLRTVGTGVILALPALLLALHWLRGRSRRGQQA